MLTSPAGPTHAQRATTRAAWALPATVILIVLATALPALASPIVGVGPAAVAAASVGLGLGYWLARERLAFVLALIPASLLVGSLIIPIEARYLPMMAIGAGLAVAAILGLRRGELHMVRPGGAFLGSVLLYVGWAAVTTITSTSRSTSGVYLLGLLGSLGLAFTIIPWVASGTAAQRAILTTLGTLAVVLALATPIVAVIGPHEIFGRLIGLHIIAEVVVRGQATGLIVPRATGIFQEPADQALPLAIGLIALIALMPGAKGRIRVVLGAGIAAVVLTLILTMARDGWLAAAVGAAVFGAGRLVTRQLDVTSIVVAVVVGVTLLAVLSGVLGANARYDIALQRYGLELARRLPSSPYATGANNEEEVLSIRGGSDLSGRGAIWGASIAAMKERPLLGSGLGTDPEAIKPYLNGIYAIYRGLTSHDTWLRTGVELGLPGFVFLLAYVAVVAWTALRRAAALRSPSSAEYVVTLATFALYVALIVGGTFETFLLGGLNYPSFVWAVVAALLVVAPGIVPSRTPIETSNAANRTSESMVR